MPRSQTDAVVVGPIAVRPDVRQAVRAIHTALAADLRASRGVMKPTVRTAIALALAVGGCAASQRPIEESDRIGPARAVDTSFRVTQPVVVPAPFGLEYVLPVGEYHATYVDGHGVFYASPTGVIARKGGDERVHPGGIHMGTHPGRYDAFPSLYVDLGSGTLWKLPLPDEVRQSTYGTHIVFVVNGEEVR